MSDDFLCAVTKQVYLQVFALLLSRRYASIEDVVRLKIALGQSVDIRSLLLHYNGPISGECRYRLWLHLLKYRHKRQRTVDDRSPMHSSSSSCTSTKMSPPPTTVYDYELYVKHAYCGLNSQIIGASQLGEIMRDVVRTFPNHPMFMKDMPGEAMLSKVLQSIVAIRQDIGYCQGMNFVVGALLLGRIADYFQLSDAKTVYLESLSPQKQHYRVSNRSIDTYSDTAIATWEEIFECMHLNPEEYTLKCKQIEYDVFYIMMNEFLDANGLICMAGLWRSGVPKMKLRVFQLDRILKWTLPKLHAHFIDIHMAPEVLVSQWFITLFSYTIPLNVTMQLWNYIFIDGWPAVYRISIAFLSTLESQFLSLDLEGVGSLIRNWRNDRNGVHRFDGEAIIAKAEVTIVNDEVLKQLEESYAMEMISLSAEVIDSSTPPTPSSTVSAVDESKQQVNNWLHRYGECFTSEEAHGMLKLRDDLKSMEVQVDIDKGYIQAKILRACDSHRELQSQLLEAVANHDRCIEAVVKTTDDFDIALEEARAIAVDAVALNVGIDTKSNSSTSSLSGVFRALLNINRASKDDDILQLCSEKSQICQQKVIQCHRALENAKHNASLASSTLRSISVAEEELVEWKKCLCDQFQLLVEDANRDRSMKLQFLTNTHSV